MNLKDVVTYIITDPIIEGEGMNSIITAIKERQRMNRASQKAVAKATLQRGMVVTVSGISPKYFNGMKGKIVDFNQTRTRADIEIVDNNGSYKVSIGTIKHGFPVQCLTPVEPKSVLTESDGKALMDFMEGM